MDASGSWLPRLQSALNAGRHLPGQQGVVLRILQFRELRVMAALRSSMAAPFSVITRFAMALYSGTLPKARGGTSSPSGIGVVVAQISFAPVALSLATRVRRFF